MFEIKIVYFSARNVNVHKQISDMWKIQADFD